MHSPTTSVFILLAMAGQSLAQTSTITLYVPGADTQPLVASVVASDPTATTYAVQCAPGTDSNDCGFNGIFTLTEGPATAKCTFPAELDANGTLAFTGYIDCALAGTTSAVCIESFDGNEANSPGITTETYTGTDQPYMPVIITAGATGSAASISPSSVVPSITNSENSVAPTSTLGESTKASGSKGSSTATGVVQTAETAQSTPSVATTSTAGVPAATGNMVWALGGAVVALAMM